MRLKREWSAWRLSLFGWPPVASHMACLVCGLALANLSWGGEPPAPKLPPQSVLLTVPNAVASRAAEALAKPGARVHVVRAGAGCRLMDAPLLVYARGPSPVLGVAYGGAAGLDEAVRELKKGDAALREATAASALPRCGTQPKVVYGGA